MEKLYPGPLIRHACSEQILNNGSGNVTCRWSWLFNVRPKPGRNFKIFSSLVIVLLWRVAYRCRIFWQDIISSGARDFNSGYAPDVWLSSLTKITGECSQSSYCQRGTLPSVPGPDTSTWRIRSAFISVFIIALLTVVGRKCLRKLFY